MGDVEHRPKMPSGDSAGIAGVLGVAGPAKMADVPGIKDIVNAGKFELDTLKISKHCIECAMARLGGKAMDIALLTASGSNAAIALRRISRFDRLVIPGSSKTHPKADYLRLGARWRAAPDVHPPSTSAI